MPSGKPIIIFFDNYYDSATHTLICDNLNKLKQAGYSIFGFETKNENRYDEMRAEKNALSEKNALKLRHEKKDQQEQEIEEKLKQENCTSFVINTLFEAYNYSIVNLNTLKDQNPQINTSMIFQMSMKLFEFPSNDPIIKANFKKNHRLEAQQIIESYNKAEENQGLVIFIDWRHFDLLIELQALGFSNFISVMAREEALIQDSFQGFNLAGNPLEQKLLTILTKWQEIEQSLISDTRAGQVRRAEYFPSGLVLLNKHINPDLDICMEILTKIAEKEQSNAKEAQKSSTRFDCRRAYNQCTIL